MSARFTAAVLTALLTACGGGPPPEPLPPADIDVARAREAGMRAFADRRFGQAARAFARALDAAYRGDDAQAVVDARYNLAASLAELGQHRDARDLLRDARAELRRAGLPVPADVILLDATIAYRSGELETARTLSEAVRARAASNGPIAARSWFLSGLIAADEDDTDSLQAALTALDAAAADPRLVADRLELRARLDALRARPDAAIEGLLRASRARSELGDYRATARALGRAGETAAAAGRRGEAAAHFLRAGRGAATLADKSSARRWLESARDLALEAADAQTAAEASVALDAL